MGGRTPNEPEDTKLELCDRCEGLLGLTQNGLGVVVDLMRAEVKGSDNVVFGA